MTIDQIQQNIIKEMAGLEDWLDKYNYLIVLGSNLPGMDDKFMVEENVLPGCQSRVWIVAELNKGNLQFNAFSDSAITQGFLALILKVFNNQHPRDIASANLYFIQQTGLANNLSPTRANGLSTIVKHLKNCAKDYIPTR